LTEKILIIGPAWVGDMVMAQCLFKLLREHRPGVILDVMGPAWSMPLIARMPEVTSAITMPIGHGELKLRERYQFAKQLHAQHYSQAIVLPNSFKSALIPWWAKIPIRTGWLGEMRWFALNDIRHLDKSRYPLMIERFMALGLKPNEPLPKIYPIPALQVTPASQAATLAKHGIQVGTQPILVLCPGAEFGPSKRWPEEHYAAIANQKIQEGFSVWLLGSSKDATVTEKIMALTQRQCLDLAGQTTLEGAVDLLSLATLVVSNDSGLMHIAAALHKPLVAIYGSTSPTFTPPLQKQAKVVSLSLSCQPCFQRICPLKHHRCMRDLMPEKVLHEISVLLKT